MLHSSKFAISLVAISYTNSGVLFKYENVLHSNVKKALAIIIARNGGDSFGIQSRITMLKEKWSRTRENGIVECTLNIALRER